MRPAWLVKQEAEEVEAAAAKADKRKSKKEKGSTRQQNGADEGDNDDEVVLAADTDAEMMAMMGFGGFASTAGVHVSANNGAAKGAAAKSKAEKYRQYMNREGGFNRALDSKG